jgi:hypothetical protein
VGSEVGRAGDGGCGDVVRAGLLRGRAGVLGFGVFWFDLLVYLLGLGIGSDWGFMIDDGWAGLGWAGLIPLHYYY